MTETLPYLAVKFSSYANDLAKLCKEEAPATELLPALFRRIRKIELDSSALKVEEMRGHWNILSDIASHATRLYTLCEYHIDVTKRTLDKHKHSHALTAQALEHLTKDDTATRFVEIAVQLIDTSCRDAEQRIRCLESLLLPLQNISFGLEEDIAGCAR